MKKAWFFWRSIFMKIYMQVPIINKVTYIKSKNPPRMATLNYELFATPGRQCHRAHYTIVHKKAWWELFSFPLLCETTVIRANAYLVSPTPRRLAAAAYPRRIFLFYICNYIYYRYLHVNFQIDWPSKKPSFFHLKLADIVFRSHCTCNIPAMTCVNSFYSNKNAPFFKALSVSL